MIQIGSLFSGIGGLEYGLTAGLARHGHRSRVAWQVEQDATCRQILKKLHPSAWRYKNVREIGKYNLPPVHIITGGFPCQDLSVAGKMAGLNGERSGLFHEMARICGELLPDIVVMENVAGIFAIDGALHSVFGKMADIGYNAAWGTLRAGDLGAPHRRERFFAVCWRLANSERKRIQFEPVTRGLGSTKSKASETQSAHRQMSECGSPQMANSDKIRLQGSESLWRDLGQLPQSPDQSRTDRDKFQWENQPRLGRSPHGFPNWMDVYTHRWPASPGPQYEWEPPRVHPRTKGDRARLRALGNAVCPQQAAIIGEWIATNLLEAPC